MTHHVLRLLPIVVGMASWLMFTACDKAEPVMPENEVENKLHEDPFEAEFVLVEGRLPQEQWDQKPTITAPKYLDQQRQRMVWKLHPANGDDLGGWRITKDSPVKEFKVKTTQDEPSRVYAFYVTYKTYQGKEMNEQFFDNAQNVIHQHFFLYYAFGRRITKFEKIPWDYRYADSNPLSDDRGQYIADKDPLGFKGLFRFLKPEKTQMKVLLVHHRLSKYNRDGKYSPFYRPSAIQMSEEPKDIDISLPITIE